MRAWATNEQTEGFWKQEESNFVRCFFFILKGILEVIPGLFQSTLHSYHTRSKEMPQQTKRTVLEGFCNTRTSLPCILRNCTAVINLNAATIYPQRRHNNSSDVTTAVLWWNLGKISVAIWKEYLKISYSMSNWLHINIPPPHLCAWSCGATLVKGFECHYSCCFRAFSKPKPKKYILAQLSSRLK